MSRRTWTCVMRTRCGARAGRGWRDCGRVTTPARRCRRQARALPRRAIGAIHRAVARADADWVAALAGQLERDMDLRQRLTVVADNAGVVRDGRFIIARHADPGT